MTDQSDVVDSSSPDKIGKAIKKVNDTPGLRSKPGLAALQYIFVAPKHQVGFNELRKNMQSTLEAHFGHYCKRVAELIGDDKPREFALTDSLDDQGERIIRLKSAVVLALEKYPWLLDEPDW